MYSRDIITYAELEEAIDNKINRAKEICKENSIHVKPEIEKLFTIELFLLYLPINWEIRKNLEKKLTMAREEIEAQYSADKFSA